MTGKLAAINSKKVVEKYEHTTILADDTDLKKSSLCLYSKVAKEHFSFNNSNSFQLFLIFNL